MSCNSQRVINNEDYSQLFRYVNCEGFPYTATILAGQTALFPYVSEIVEYGTLELDPPIGATPQERLIADIRYYNNIEWGEVYEVSSWYSEDSVIDNDYGLYYVVEANSDNWQYQLTNFDIENNTWEEI
jgi:hypothetical protein